MVLYRVTIIMCDFRLVCTRSNCFHLGFEIFVVTVRVFGSNEEIINNLLRYTIIFYLIVNYLFQLRRLSIQTIITRSFCRGRVQVGACDNVRLQLHRFTFITVRQIFLELYGCRCTEWFFNHVYIVKVTNNCGRTLKNERYTQWPRIRFFFIITAQVTAFTHVFDFEFGDTSYSNYYFLFFFFFCVLFSDQYFL